MEVLLDQKQIEQAVSDLATSICSKYPPLSDVAVIGIRSRGEILAQRLSKLLSEKANAEIPCGVLDITLYRDDLNSPSCDFQPIVQTTEIGFNIDNKILILVDDVLYTGRSVRAAMDALIDLGRPKAIKLAVLVERTGREFPIQPDFAAINCNPKNDENVQVNLIESDGKDQVVIE